ncbi:hypothetical protein OROMI_017434 [Orobanche minor]
MLDVSGRRPTKRRRTESPSGATLPMDLWTNILARVGSTSLVDVFNAKRTGFRAAIDSDLVYRKVSLEILPRVLWKHLED